MASSEPESEAPEVSVIVVSYNTSELTLACLKSVFEQTRDHSIEVIVIDNASTDGSAQEISVNFPQLRLIASDENHGFAKANNIAVSTARGEWILLLNPDTVVLNRAIDTLVDFAIGHPEASIFGGRTLYADGSLNPTSCWNRPTLWSSFCLASGLAHLFRGSRVFDAESMGHWKRDSVREVDIVTGCFFLLRKADWIDLGGFDSRFFMYGEEADLCLRAGSKGLKCMVCPEAEIIHYGGAAETVRADKMVRLFRAKAQLFAAHWHSISARLGVQTLNLWALVRIAGFSLGRLANSAHAEKLRTWRSVWSRRKEWRITPRDMA